MAFTQAKRIRKTIHSCLNPYIQAVKNGFAFNEIQTIMSLFQNEDYEKDIPLNGSYLIGYYHERSYIDSLAKAAGNKSQLTNSRKKENDNDGE